MRVELKQSDQSLLERCRNGEDTAFRQLVDRYGSKVRTTVIGMLGDTAEANDVAQEVFIRFYKALKDFRGDAKLGTYLTRIAINLSLNELKRRKNKGRWMTFFKGGDDNRQEIQIEDHSANPNRQDTKELVQKALQILEPEFRSIVVLRMIEGYSVKEAAEILNLPQGTVASRLSRGQKKLKEILSKFI